MLYFAFGLFINTVFDFVSKHPSSFDLIEWVCFDGLTLKYYEEQINDHG